MQGHEKADIDPWEDPSFDIYHTTDRYGFIQYVTRVIVAGELCKTLTEFRESFFIGQY